QCAGGSERAQKSRQHFSSPRHLPHTRNRAVPFGTLGHDGAGRCRRQGPGRPEIPPKKTASHPRRFGNQVAIAGNVMITSSSTMLITMYGTTARKMWAIVTCGGATPFIVISRSP